MPTNKRTIPKTLTTPSYFNVNSNLRTRPVNKNVRPQSSLTNTEYTTGYQISPLDLHAPVQSENDELIHQSPVKTLLLNNTIYHDDSYTSLNEESNDSSKERDESYQVSEHPQESRKQYKKKPPKRKALSFVINVEDTSKEPSIKQQTFVEPSTKQQTFVEPSPSQPLALPFISPLRSNIGRDLTNTRKQVKPHSNNGSVKRITDEIKHFQDIFVSQNSPHELEFGHVLDSPELSEERFEQKDFKEQRHRGKVRWTDKNGGYGEHYWDLEHSKKMS